MEVIRFYSEKANYGELSNFYFLASSIIYDQKSYPSSEHLYQSLKFIYPDAPSVNATYADVIRTANTPFKSKLLANQRTPLKYPWQQQLHRVIQQYPDARINPAWETVKDEMMLLSLRLKFQVDQRCREVLLSTGDARLEEQSTDPHWGNGGKNMLGELLVQVRKELRQSQNKEKD